MCAGVAGIAAEGAVSAVVAAEIGQRQKDFARVGDDAGLEAFFGGAGGGEEFGKIVVGAADQAQRGFARDGDAGAHLGERRGACRALLVASRRDGGQGHVDSNDTTAGHGNVGGCVVET